MTVARINKAIAHLGLEIIRGEGYQYFLSLKTGDQIGESVYVCYLNHLTLKQWVEAAESEVKRHKETYIDHNF